MEKTTFINFQEASDFAKKLGRQSVAHNLRRDGENWTVFHEQDFPAVSETSEHPRIRELELLLTERDSNIADLQGQLSALQERIEQEISARSYKLDLIEIAYRAKFGAAEVQSVRETIESKSVCPRCGGDGGIRGGCYKCDGSGWLTSSETFTRDYAVLISEKAGDISEPPIDAEISVSHEHDDDIPF